MLVVVKTNFRPTFDDIQIDLHDKIMDEQQLADITRLAQQQQEQIKMLVNLLLALLKEEEGQRNEAARNSAENLIFIRTKLYDYIDAEGDVGLWHEQIRNKFRRKIVEAELRRYE